MYILSEIKDSEGNPSIERKNRIKENEKKYPKPFAEIVTEVKKIYDDLYDVNLYIYKAKKNLTIIEIRYYPRSSLSPEYKNEVETRETMLHCKVATPIYYSEDKEKFDINWQFEPFNHKWKMFWNIRKFKQELKKRNKIK